MAIRLFLILIWILSTPSFAQVLLESGQFAGTLPESQNSSPISYFVRDLEEFKQLEAWASESENSEKIRLSSTIYDNFIVVVHPKGVVDGKIDPKISTYAEQEVIAEISKFISGAFWFSSTCVALPSIVAKNGNKKILLIIYVMETGEQRQCLKSAFSLVSR